MPSTGFFNEKHLRNWAQTRKSMVTERYERELVNKAAEDDYSKKWEKVMKRTKKILADSI